MTLTTLPHGSGSSSVNNIAREEEEEKEEEREEEREGNGENCTTNNHVHTERTSDLRQERWESMHLDRHSLHLDSVSSHQVATLMPSRSPLLSAIGRVILFDATRLVDNLCVCLAIGLLLSITGVESVGSVAAAAVAAAGAPSRVEASTPPGKRMRSRTGGRP